MDQLRAHATDRFAISLRRQAALRVGQEDHHAATITVKPFRGPAAAGGAPAAAPPSADVRSAP